MSREHFMLRTRRRAGTGGPFGPLGVTPFGPLGIGPGAAVVTPDEIEVKIETAILSDQDVLDAVADPNIAAMAPIMPTRLIAPEASPEAAAAGPTWGVSAVGANLSPFDGNGITVAILDSGIDSGHVAFAGVSMVQVDFTGTGNGDGNGHGTHCAGTVFGRDVAGTRIGVARGVTDALIGKVLTATGSGQTDWLQNAILWASDHGAHVISISIGIDFPGAVNDLVVKQGLPIAAATSMALRDYGATLRAFDALLTMVRARATFGHGSMIVAASGNESERKAAPPFTIAASLPAETRDVVAIGAAMRQPPGLAVAPFSNVFPQAVGPGVDIVSAKAGTPNGLVAFNGTSMATPHAAGVAALWWQQLGPMGTAALATNRLIGNASIAGFAAPSAADIGSGLVKAP